MRRRLAVLVVISLFSIAAFAQAVDKEALAQRIVTQSAEVKEGDLVFINGSVRDDSDRMTRRMFIDVPATYDAQFPKWFALLANSADVVVSIDSGEGSSVTLDGKPLVEKASRASETRGRPALRRPPKVISIENY